MNKAYLIVIVAALSAALFALAHVDQGAPKSYRESQAEWSIHDYGVHPLPNHAGAVGVLQDCGYGIGLGDGHAEYHVSGAHILACDVDRSGTGLGADDCYGESAHHIE